MASQSGKKRGLERRAGRAARRRAPSAADRLPFQRQNWILFAIALAVIVLGYISLAQGSITLAPILLVLGYCVLIPAAIMFKPKPGEAQDLERNRANSSAG